MTDESDESMPEGTPSSGDEAPVLSASEEAVETVGPGPEMGDRDLLELAREDALDFLEGLLESMELTGEISVEVSDESLSASINGGDLGILIGRHGHTLAALQELLRAAVQHQAQDRVRVTLDIEGYRERRREVLQQEAQEAARRAIEEAQEIELDPMPAYERKVVHDAIAEIEGVTSFSEGEEPYRKVVIRPEPRPEE